ELAGVYFRLGGQSRNEGAEDEIIDLLPSLFRSGVLFIADVIAQDEVWTIVIEVEAAKTRGNSLSSYVYLTPLNPMLDDEVLIRPLTARPKLEHLRPERVVLHLPLQPPVSIDRHCFIDAYVQDIT